MAVDSVRHTRKTTTMPREMFEEIEQIRQSACRLLGRDIPASEAVRQVLKLGLGVVSKIGVETAMLS